MEKLYKLKEKMKRELEEIASKPELGAGDLELAHKLTDTIKNIDKICMLEEDGGYSEGGDWEADMRGTYGRGGSYANRGKHLVRSHYSWDGRDGGDGYSERRGGGRGGRGGRGGYSQGDGTEEMMQHVRMAIDAAPDGYKEDIRRFMRELED